MNAYWNRELSWLKFNERVLEEAESESVPLCERLSFASIYQNNLDEFFMVRVGSLADRMLLSKNLRDSKTHMTAEEQIRAVLKDVARLNRRKDAVYATLMSRLEDCGVRLVNFKKLEGQESRELERYFDAEIAPLLSPTLVTRRQPFPFLQNREIYAVGVLVGKSGKEKLAFVGDGINDAPVLSRADIGIAMGALGSDAAIEAADIVLMDDDPLKIAKAIRISRKCIRIVYENIYFAIGIKVICLVLGALGIANMWFAIFADVGVMILAVLNAIRTLFVKKL